MFPTHRRILSVFYITILALLSGLSAAWAGNPANLRCEYLANPMGIDIPQPRLSWVIESSHRGEIQTAYQVLVASTPKILAKAQGDLWDSGKISSDQTSQISYAGTPLTSRQQCWWKIRYWNQDGKPSAWSQPAQWSMGLLDRTDWQAKMIAANWPGPVDMPLPWFRKTFTLDSAPKNATAYVCALGYYELYVNGCKVDDHVLSPAICDYANRGFYVTHDISRYLIPGKNCIGLWLGRGWFSKGRVRGAFHDGPVVMAQFEIGDGLRICTDETWKVRRSPITALGAGIVNEFGGEKYDATLDLPDWNNANLNDSDWASPVIVQPPAISISAQMVEPNRITESFSAVAVSQVAPGKYTVDMGQDFTGWIRLNLKARKGQAIRIDYPYPVAGAQHDEYVPNADTSIVWQNCRFNYHATRTFTLSGLDTPPSPRDITGHMIHTDYEHASQFTCSNELLNWIQRTAAWTERCLSLGACPVDCPHRERAGYGGDGQAAMEEMLNNFGAGAFYTKWLRDWHDSQGPNGDMMHIAPVVTTGAGGGPAWNDVCVTLPWQVYLRYGDRRVLESNFQMIQRWLDFQKSKTKDGLLIPYPTTGFGSLDWCYLGDWVPPRGPDANTSRSVFFFNNVYYLYVLETAENIARVIGKTTDADNYAQQVASLRTAIHKEFPNENDKAYDHGLQTPLSLSLLTSLIAPDQRAAVEARLEHDILVDHKGHIDTGIHGTYLLVKELTALGRNDLLFTMATKTDFPSYAHMRNNGATTIWEQWDGDNSRIHRSFISIGAWFIEGLGGIQLDPSHPGYSHFTIKPAVVGDLRYARTSFKSIKGDIISNWQRDGSQLCMDITIPANTTATVYVPAKDASDVTESGKPTAKATGLKFLRVENNVAVYAVSSGTYQFRSTLP